MKHSININLLLLATSLFTACSSEDTPNPTINPANDPDAIELGITAGVALTKSAISKPADLTAGIAVYACLNGSAASGMEDPYTADKKNNYAVYKTSDGTTWATDQADKIRLTSQEAKIYAYYPAIAPGTGGVFQSTGTALQVSGTISDDATVGITVFPGETTEDTNNKITIPADKNNADKYYSSSWIANTEENKKVIYTAPGEVDYMYADNNTQLIASNGKASGASADAYKVNLDMKHALSMVSFRIYNDGTYNNTGKLTKITLKNKDSETVLNGDNPTMKIKDGIISFTTANAVIKYTRFIGTDGYTLIKNTGTASTTTATTNTEASEAAKKFSILVLPDGNTKFDKPKVEVVFTIDGADYPVALTDPSDDNGKWIAGKNYLYTAKLSGKELTISSVTVSEWTAATGGDLNVN